MYKGKNLNMANKGKQFEEEVNRSNIYYKNSGLALVQKISTPWNVVRIGNQIVSAFPQGKSTLDFRGTVSGGISISFDCKESNEEKGLYLKNIEEHQIEYIKKALEVGEISFILCKMKQLDESFYIPGERVLEYWELWKKNKGRRGFNYIPHQDMEEIEIGQGGYLDYIKNIESEVKH